MKKTTAKNSFMVLVGIMLALLLGAAIFTAAAQSTTLMIVDHATGSFAEWPVDDSSLIREFFIDENTDYPEFNVPFNVLESDTVVKRVLIDYHGFWRFEANFEFGSIIYFMFKHTPDGWAEVDADTFHDSEDGRNQLIDRIWGEITMD
jgi:hypothetical protein